MPHNIYPDITPSSPTDSKLSDLVAQIVGRATLLRDGVPDSDLRAAGDHYFRIAVTLWTAAGFSRNAVDVQIAIQLADMQRVRP